MGYDLHANADVVEPFHFGAFAWLPLIDACGYLWPCISKGAQWYCVRGVDPRLGDHYPLLFSNDGFEATEEEANIMARMARNFVAIQRSLPEEQRSDALGALTNSIHGTTINEKWPVKIRDDFVDLYEEFAEWAPRSKGFRIY